MNLPTVIIAGARCAGFLMKAPGFSHPSVPKTIRVTLALLLAIALGSALPPMRMLEPFALVITFIRESLLGAAMGMVTSAFYDGAYAGGRALDDYLGVRASMPAANVQSGNGFGRLWSDGMLAAFYLLGGVETLIAMFAHTFVVLPLGTLPNTQTMFSYALLIPRTVLEAALTIVGPAIALAFFAQIALAAVGRIVPRFSTFALSFPIIFAAALFVTVAAAPCFLEYGAHPWLGAQL